MQSRSSICGPHWRSRQALTESQRAELQRLVATATANTGRYELDRSPENATLLVGGNPPTLDADGVLLLDIGRHEIAARPPVMSNAA